MSSEVRTQTGDTLLSLNPYYTGSYSMSLPTFFAPHSWSSLNPYYTGSYSMSMMTTIVSCKVQSRLNPYYTGSYSMSPFLLTNKDIDYEVLILIILEVTL